MNPVWSFRNLCYQSAERGFNLGQSRIFSMDESGDQADEQQAGEKPIGVEEQKTIESQEAQAEKERSTEDVEPSRTTTEEIIGKAQESEQSEANSKQNIKEKSKPVPKISLQNYSISLPNICRPAK